MSREPARRADVAVVGGGPAGSASAIALRQLGRSVTLVDDAPGRFKVGESLPPACNPVLRRLGISDADMREHHVEAWGNRSCWGADEPKALDFVRSPHGHGWHLDRSRFDAQLLDRARQGGADVISGSRVESIRPGTPSSDGDAHWRLELRAGDGSGPLEVDWIVDASGRRRFLARRFEIPVRRLDHLSATWCVFTRDDDVANATVDRDSRILVEATEFGWWYTALLPGARRIAVFCCDREDAVAGALRTQEGFIGALESTRHIAVALATGRYRPVGRPVRTNADSSRMESVCGPGWLSVGDAAYACDPVSSQGILASIYSAERAAGAVSAALDGDLDALNTYRDFVDESFDAFVHNRRLAYRTERRWPDAHFWRTRHLEADAI